MKRKKRDLYGNWVWEDEDDRYRNEKDDEGTDARRSPIRENKVEGQDRVNLDWRDVIALTIASLQTFLLPIIIFIVLLIAIVLGLAIFH